ncbi:MAG: hypothetical protein CSA10_00395 [Cardiobacteriales bacterium]|nr:MAG: hypothetical protein CSA10_00395 [Cardiobacteriales bacterium]
MIVIRYDGSFDGFLTAVFIVYRERFSHVQLLSGTGQVSDLLARHIEIATEADKAKRVFAKLKQVFGYEELRYFLYGRLFEAEDRDDTLLAVIRYAIKQAPRQILNDYGQPDVLRLSQFVKSVKREQHRLKGFVRFAQTQDGQFIAPVAPDYDVLPLVAPFFAKRFGDQRWTIADVKRHYAVFYDLHNLQSISLSVESLAQLRQAALADDERFYQKLWQDYFQVTAISERRNMRLHAQQMPRRYWRYLTEKQYIK